MKIPRKIQVGNIEHRIKYKFPMRCQGYLDLITNKIYLHRYLKKQKRLGEVAFFHEITHSLVEQMSEHYPQLMICGRDEQFITMLAYHFRLLFHQINNNQPILKNEKTKEKPKEDVK